MTRIVFTGGGPDDAPGSGPDETETAEVLQDLAEWIDENDDVEAVADVRTREPGPGELGGVADAVEVLAALTPLAKVVASWLKERLKNGVVDITATKADGTSMHIKAADEGAAERLIPRLSEFFQPDAPAAVSGAVGGGRAEVPATPGDDGADAD